MIISDRIFEILKEKGIKQREFSERTGIPQSTISDWKGKRVNPASDKIMIICEVLEITPYELLTGTDSKNYAKPEHIVIDKGTREFELVGGFQKLNMAQKERVLGYVDGILKK